MDSPNSKRAHHAERRVVTRFAWLPKKMGDGQWIWLKKYQRYSHFGD